MTPYSMRRLALLLGLLLCSSTARADELQTPASAVGLTPSPSQTIARKVLRGYGPVEGTFTEYVAADGRRSSVLVITCADAEHASLCLGKYSSDLHSLGGVADAKLAVDGVELPVVEVPGQGSIVACRAGRRVAIVAAAESRDLIALLSAMQVARVAELDFADGKVPMYLDRYDQFGWHFYFNPWTTPPKDPDYDLDASFQYLAKHRLGMMTALSLNNLDGAEGVIEYAHLAWAIERGRQLSVPTFLQAWAIGAPRLLVNRFPYDTMLKMPQFVGNFYCPGENGGGYPPEIAWSSEDAEDILLDWLRPIYHRYASYPNITGYAEPHGEIEHTTPMIFTDYGPVADAAYRRFLREKYETCESVDQRWHGGRGVVKSWDDVRVPEVAGFLGWNADAVDVGGRWRFAYDRDLSAKQLEQWADPALGDADWSQLTAPGDDHPRFRNQQQELRVPAVFRRTFSLGDGQLRKLLEQGQGKCYLYVWSLDRSREPLTAAINGVQVGTAKHSEPTPAWHVFEVGQTLRNGENLLALHLPWCELAYRIYLSPAEPRRYPDLGPEGNARWVDFRDFALWVRAGQVRKGMELIRREDTDKYIKLMSPNGMIDVAKALAEDYGGTFHNTGYMAAWWNEYLPGLMRSSGLPMTVEPGGPAQDLRELRRFIGHWMTEGVQGVDYFYNLGDILWNPEQRPWFDANLPLVRLIGKYHVPRADVAVMYSGRTDRLADFPWDGFDGENFGLPGEFWSRMQLETRIPPPHDIVLDTDFTRGNADKYRVILDAGTVVMEPALVERIEQWVRDGGILITCNQTGRHTPEVKDAWPLARLSGYRIAPQRRNGKLSAPAGQDILTAERWTKPFDAGGWTLEPAADDVVPLLLWHDGATAVGMRRVGKGSVVTAPTQLDGMLDDLLRWAGCYTEPLAAPRCLPRRFVSNNGLFDVFVLWANQAQEPTEVALRIPGPAAPTALRNVATGATLQGTTSDAGTQFGPIAVQSQDVHGYLAPRGQIAVAPREWFLLQRDWWQGTVEPRPAPKVPALRNAIPLNEDWAFAPVSAAEPAAAKLDPAAEDVAWARIDLGIWNVQGFPKATAGVFRKQVTIPAGWNSGRVWAWLAGSGDMLRPPYRVKFYVDGKLSWTSGNSRYSLMSIDLTDALPPGRHLLAWEMEGTGKFDGVVGDMWLEYVPNPVFTQSLAGQWSTGTLPGRATLTGAKRTFTLDPRAKDYLVQFYIDGRRSDVQSVFINNTNVYFYGGPRGNHRRMTLNPWLNLDGENEIELKPYYDEPMDIESVELRFYRPDQL